MDGAYCEPRCTRSAACALYGMNDVIEKIRLDGREAGNPAASGISVSTVPSRHLPFSIFVLSECISSSDVESHSRPGSCRIRNPTEITPLLYDKVNQPTADS